MRTNTFLKDLLEDRSGATAIEYGLIVSLIVVAMIAALEGVANENSGLWATVTDKVTVAIEG